MTAPNILLKVSYRTQDWQSMVIREWGQEWSIPEWVYQFQNDRKFESSDMSTSGFYRRT